MHTTAHAILIVCLLLLLKPAFAAESSKPCYPADTIASSQGFVLSFLPFCEKVPLSSLTKDPALVASIETWVESFGEEKRSLDAIYRYRLTIVNGSGSTFDMSPAGSPRPGPSLLFSPFVHMIGAFFLRLEPCTKVTISFLSPGAPRTTKVWFYLGTTVGRENKWAVIGGTGIEAFVPWSQLYHPEYIRHEPLSKTDAATHACK